MSILEKLGINTPDEIQLVKHCYEVFKLAGLKKPKLDDLFQEAKQLKKILDERNELLEALIGVYEDYTLHNTERIRNLIEKATGKSIEEIKELSNA